MHETTYPHANLQLVLHIDFGPGLLEHVALPVNLAVVGESMRRRAESRPQFRGKVRRKWGQHDDLHGEGALVLPATGNTRGRRFPQAVGQTLHLRDGDAQLL